MTTFNPHFNMNGLIFSFFRFPHQLLEECIRDLHRDVQRQLIDRQSNDTQLSILELILSYP